MSIVDCNKSVILVQSAQEIQSRGHPALVLGGGRRRFALAAVPTPRRRVFHDLALYAYLAPFKAEIYYLGKCDRTSVRGRAAYSAKSGAWDCINKLSKTHRVIVAEIEVGQRLTRELLADVESLLIFTIQPCCNVQNTQSRGKHCRPGMRIECKGEAWPLSKRVYYEIEGGD